MDDNQIIKTENPDYVRDLHSKALLSTDLGELERARSRRSRSIKQKQIEQEVAVLRTFCNDLDAKMDRIVTLLESVIKSL